MCSFEGEKVNYTVDSGTLHIDFNARKLNYSLQYGAPMLWHAVEESLWYRNIMNNYHVLYLFMEEWLIFHITILS